MGVTKILFFSALFATTIFVCSMASPKGNRASPNNEKLTLRHKTNVFNNSNEKVYANHVAVCQTAECHKIASAIISSMNKSIDPCEDFYQFTCDRWGVNNPIRSGEMDSSHFRSYQYLAYQRVREILEKEPDSNDILPVKHAKKYYRSCVDSESLNRIGIEPINSIVMLVGGWPIAMENSNWDYENYPWQKIESHYARLTGSHTFYDIIANAPTDDSKIGKIIILPPTFLWKRNVVVNIDVMNIRTYYTIFGSALTLFAKRNGAEVSYEEVAKDFLDLMQFESELYELISEYDSDNPSEWTNSSMPFHEFIDWCERNMTKAPTARIDLSSEIQSLFDPLKIKINPCTTIDMNIEYIEGLDELLKRTSSRTIANYVHWNFISTTLPHTTQTMGDKFFKISSSHRSYGVKEKSPRWVECVEEAKDRMTNAVAYAFSEKYFPKSTENAARKMLKSIKGGLEANIDNSNWLDRTSKSLAKEKLKFMSMLTGYPEWYNNATDVTNYYKGLTIGSQYFDNFLSTMRFERIQKLMPYATHDAEKPSGFYDPLTVNAQYDYDLNTINVPPVMFQSPLLTPGLPEYINYGHAGSSIAHEIGHGFDTTGIRHDKDGSDTELSKKILKSYYQLAHCFVDQYNRYFGVTEEPPEEGVTLEYDDFGDSRGSMTRAENIADTTGLQAVFQAYKNLKKTRRTTEPKLPGLEEFTDEQLFFIAFGEYGCSVQTPEFDEWLLEQPYSPEKLRVNGAVSNTIDFAKIFNCPKGSSMNPIDKCNIWKKPVSKTKVMPRSRNKGKNRNPNKRKNN